MATLGVAIIGGIVAAGVAYLLTPSINTNQEGARLTSSRLTTSTEGAGIVQLFGRQRLGGQIIWATEFKETVTQSTQSSGGKGGGGGRTTTTTTYNYSISFAMAFCEANGKASMSRLWADGKEIDISTLNVRFYDGSDTQMPDPHIEAVQGAGTVPAYCGIAYAVFEDLELANFGNRVPQFTAEIVVPLDTDDPDDIQNAGEAFCLIPASGETIYQAEAVQLVTGRNTTKPDNVHNAFREPDVVYSMDNLIRMQDNLDAVLLVVSWFGNDLRAGTCTIRPRTESQDNRTLTPTDWTVSTYTRATAEVVPYDDDGRPEYGGTPSDASILSCIAHLKSKGLRVVFYPFILMVQEEGNSLPNPYSDNEATLGQPVKPWRGRITCSPADGYVGSPNNTAAAATQINAFFDEYDAMVEHYADLCAAAGGVDGFIVGTELPGITKVRSATGVYPAVSRLQTLAAYAKTAMPTAKVGYAADWSEWVDDASDGYWFHLDPLWADANVDFCGVDNYLPLSDWRDGTQHADYDAINGPTSEYDVAYLKSQIEGGEYYEYFYANTADRINQVRSPIADVTYNEPWVYRRKSFREWWLNEHYNRPGHIRDASPTAWVPGSKPVWFTEFGVPAVNKGTNQPNVFFDPSSSESALPYFSSGSRDDFIQRIGVEATYSYWRDNAPVHPSTAAADLTIPRGDYASSLPSRSADVVMSGTAVLPVSPTDCVLVEFGGGGWGIAIVVRDGGTILRYRAGKGSRTNPTTDCAMLDLSIVDLPFDGEAHVLAWDVDVSTGVIRLWIDGTLVGTAATVDNTAFIQWAGTGSGVWLTGAGAGTNMPGEPTAVSNYEGSDLSIWSSTTHGENKMLDGENMFVWTWDARPFPDYPVREDVWSDGSLWFKGHWWTGRIESIPLARLVAHLCRRAGLTDDQYDTSGLYGPGALVRGFRIDEPEPLRDSLKSLMDAYQFDAFESEGKIKFVLRINTKLTTISDSKYVVTDANPVGAEVTRGQETDLPQKITVEYIDEFNDFNEAAVDGKASRGYSQNVDKVKVPINLTEDYAKGLADSKVQQAWIERQRGKMVLPPSLAWLDPGDAAAFPISGLTITARFTSISIAESMDVEFYAFDPQMSRLPVVGEEERLPGLVGLYGQVAIHIMDLPLFTGEEPSPHAPRVAAVANPWPGGINVYKRNSDDTYNFNALHPYRNGVGELGAALSAGVTGSIDHTNTLNVIFEHGSLQSQTEAQMYESALALGVYNAAKDEWEIIQFADAALQPDGSYNVTNMLRGQLGTEHAMGEPDVPTGSVVVILEPSLLTPLNVSFDLAGNAITYRYGPSRYAVSDDTYKETTFTGKRVGLRPYSPTNLRMTQAAQDLKLSWVRRTRFDGDSWEIDEVPLNETNEQYRVRIYHGVSVVREVEITTPAYTYAEADQITDFGAAQTQLTIDVAQYGSSFGGYGIVATATLEIGKVEA